MDLAEYQTLTGVTVPTAQVAKVTATIARTRSILETMLGFSLSSGQRDKNLYKELGKSSQNCFCPSVDLENLEAPDDVEGAYRLYRFNDLDTYFHIDPAVTIYKVKLVYIKSGSGDNGITVKTFDDDELRINYGMYGLTKYIEHCKDCLCACDCTDCVQLAVDADWMFEGCLPADLKYVWTDMITYYTDENKSDIRSESIDTHSYTRFDNKPPEQDQQNMAVIKRYAGPFGSVTRMPV